MTSSNGNIFRVTGHLCGEFTGNSLHKGQWRGALMFALICVWINGWVNNREAGDLRRHRVHYDVIVMIFSAIVADIHVMWVTNSSFPFPIRPTTAATPAREPVIPSYTTPKTTAPPGECLILTLLPLKPECSRRTRVHTWLLMHWLLGSPGHQQPR